MELDSAVEHLKEEHTEELAEEISIDKEIPVSEAREEAKEELGYDYDSLEEEFKEIDFIPAKKNAKMRKAIEKVNSHVPIDLDSIYILSPKYYITDTASFVPAPELEKHVIVVAGSHLKHIDNINGLAGIILHEAIHRDMDENPEKYGIKGIDELGMRKLFGLDEKTINKEVEELFPEHEKVLEEAGHRAFEDWQSKELEKIWNVEPLFRILSYTRGEPYNPKWVDLNYMKERKQEEKFDNEIG